MLHYISQALLSATESNHFVRKFVVYMVVAAARKGWWQRRRPEHCSLVQPRAFRSGVKRSRPERRNGERAGGRNSLVILLFFSPGDRGIPFPYVYTWSLVWSRSLAVSVKCQLFGKRVRCIRRVPETQIPNVVDYGSGL